MSKRNKEEIRKMTFGKFQSEEDINETATPSEEGQTDDNSVDYAKKNTKGKKDKKKHKKQSLKSKLKSAFHKEKTEEVPDIWTGQTSVLDILAPSSVDNGSRDYIVVDGVYHTYLYVAGYIQTLRKYNNTAYKQYGTANAFVFSYYKRSNGLQTNQVKQHKTAHVPGRSATA